MLAMIDTKTSNLRSVENAFRRIGVDITTTLDAKEVASAEGLVIPGVGAFDEAMNGLRVHGLVEVIQRRAGEGVPLIGICVGMQLLANRSEEMGSHEGLGSIPGEVVRLEPTDDTYRVPNIGWCPTRPEKNGRLFNRRMETESFYFVHSYHLRCADPDDVAASINYSGQTITVAVERNNIFGLQFHPEKSQDAGLDLLDGLMGKLHGKCRAL